VRNVCTSTSPPSSSADILRALDQALENTFPASDPVSVEQPTSPAADRERATHTAGCDSNLDVSGKGRLAVRAVVLAVRGGALYKGR
jgi:hypothetical protein